MDSEQELRILKNENEFLNEQLEEANAALLQKEQEMAFLRTDSPQIAELQSRLDGQLDDMHQMQNIIGKKQQQAAGAEERELELNNELTIAYSLQQKYDELLTAYAYAQTQLSDIQQTLKEVKKKNELLQQTAAQAVQLQSALENAEIESAALRDAIKMLEDKS